MPAHPPVEKANYQTAKARGRKDAKEELPIAMTDSLAEG
jgi:hypothetical protein